MEDLIKILLQREMWTRLVFIQWKRHGLFSNFLAFTFSTEFCDAKMNVYSFLFVCLCARLKFSAHASVFCFCLLFFYAKLRNALRQRSRPMKKRKIACACSACHTLHTASYDLTNRSIANRATPINITMETPLMTRRDNCSFMLEFCRFTVSTLGVFYFLVIRAQPKKKSNFEDSLLKHGMTRSCTKWGFSTDVILNGCETTVEGGYEVTEA